MSAKIIQHEPASSTRLAEHAGTLVIRAVLVSDFVGSTALLEQLGDRRSALLWAKVDRLFRDLLKQYSGRELDKTDGFLMLFDRSLEAVCYAIAVHDALEQLAADEELDPDRLKVRIGIHVGEVLLRQNHQDDVLAGAKPVELEGLAKPLTARLMSLAIGGQTLLSRTAYDLARRAAVGENVLPENTQWLAHGQYILGGVSEPQDVFEVGTAGKAPLEAPPDGEKGKRILQTHSNVPTGNSQMPLVGVLAIVAGLIAFGGTWLLNRHTADSMEIRVLKSPTLKSHSESKNPGAASKSVELDEAIVEDPRTHIQYSMKVLHPDPN